MEIRGTRSLLEDFPLSTWTIKRPYIDLLSQTDQGHVREPPAIRYIFFLTGYLQTAK